MDVHNKRLSLLSVAEVVKLVAVVGQDPKPTLLLMIVHQWVVEVVVSVGDAASFCLCFPVFR